MGVEAPAFEPLGGYREYPPEEMRRRAPSGANMQPWHFVAVTDPDLKGQIREGAEAEERAFYHGRAPRAWLDALARLDTDEHKPLLAVALYLIAVFAQSYGGPARRPAREELRAGSVGIATGFLIAALHHAGLVTLTHTPSPMGFLNRLLGRPANERRYLLQVTGYPGGRRARAGGGAAQQAARRDRHVPLSHARGSCLGSSPFPGADPPGARLVQGGRARVPLEGDPGAVDGASVTKFREPRTFTSWWRGPAGRFSAWISG